MMSTGKDKEMAKTEVSLKIPVSVVISVMALFISIASLVQVKNISKEIDSATKSETSKEIDSNAKSGTSGKITTITGKLETDGNKVAYDLQDCPDDLENLLEYPYNETTQTVSGITTTDNGDGKLIISGECTGDSVVYRIKTTAALEDDIHLEKGTYRLYQGIDKDVFINTCRLDIGLTKKDGSKVIINGTGGDIVIDNTDEQYDCIYAVSLYAIKGFRSSEYVIDPALVKVDD